MFMVQQATSCVAAAPCTSGQMAHGSVRVQACTPCLSSNSLAALQVFCIGRQPSAVLLSSPVSATHHDSSLWKTLSLAFEPTTKTGASPHPPSARHRSRTKATHHTHTTPLSCCAVRGTLAYPGCVRRAGREVVFTVEVACRRVCGRGCRTWIPRREREHTKCA